MDAIDVLEGLCKSDDDDEAYMLGYKDAQAGKPPKPKKAEAAVAGEEDDGGDDDGIIEGDEGTPEPDDVGGDQPQGEDVDGDGDSDTPGTDVDGDGMEAEEEVQEGEEPGEEPAEGEEGEDGAVPGETPEEGAEDAPELPTDDQGKNYGAGDLNEDGQVQSLLQEVAAVEKDYYAAAGMHGDGHHKTGKALDVYHRVVRKLVRALMGKGANPEQEPAQDSNGDQDNAPPNGKDNGGGPPQAKGASNGDDSNDDGDQDEKKSKKKPPFGKSFDAIDHLTFAYGTPREKLDVLEKSGLFTRNTEGEITIASAPLQPPKEKPVIIKSHKNYRDMSTDPLARGAEGLRVVPPKHTPAQLVDDRSDPSLALRKSQAERLRHMFSDRNAPVSVTVDAACPIHGHTHESIYKSQQMATPYMKCSCG